MPHALCSRRLTSPTDNRARAVLDDLQRRHLLRQAPAIENRDGVHYLVDGAPVVGFCSNDYLGYASAATPAPRSSDRSTVGGAGASRLICGDLPIHREVERQLASISGCEDAVLFASGFQLNVGVLPALLRATDHVYSDRLIHASMIDGLRLSECAPQILPHLHAPPARASEQRRHTDAAASPLRWWICESLYSMDATRHDPRQLNAWTAAGHSLYLDGAHDFGLFEGGAGWTQANDVAVDLYVGTLGKAYGAAGAFVAATQPICDWIRNTARSFIFSTAMSPLVADQLLARVQHVRGADGDERRATLDARVGRMAELLELPIETAIVPLAIGDPTLALSMSRELRACGWHVQAIRPPTVPEGTSRLRLTLSAAHTPAHLEGLAVAIKTLYRRANHPLRLATPP